MLESRHERDTLTSEDHNGGQHMHRWHEITTFQGECLPPGELIPHCVPHSPGELLRERHPENKIFY